MATFVDAWRSAVLADTALKSRAKLLACALAEFATFTTGEGVWPSGETLADMVSSSQRTVTLARQDLASRGWIVVEKRQGAHGTIRQRLVMVENVDPKNPRNEESDIRDGRSEESAGVDPKKTTGRSEESAHKHHKNTIKEHECVSAGEVSDDDSARMYACTYTREAHTGAPGHTSLSADAPTHPPVDSSPDGETQPIRGEDEQVEVDETGRPLDRDVRMTILLKAAWSALEDTCLLGRMAHDYGVGGEGEDVLKRTLYPELRMLCAAADARRWDDRDVSDHLFERIDSYYRRDIDATRWLQLARSRQDMDESESVWDEVDAGGQNGVGAGAGSYDYPTAHNDHFTPYEPPTPEETARSMSAMEEVRAIVARINEKQEREKRERAELYARLHDELVMKTGGGV